MCDNKFPQLAMMLMVRSIFIGLLSFLVIACADPYRTVISRFNKAAVCCESISQFNFETIQIGESRSFDLNKDSPVFLFDTGKSYFKAFALPHYSNPFKVVIKSYMLGDHIDKAYIFFPQILTLNKNFELIRSSSPQIFSLKKSGFFETINETWGLMNKLEAQIHFAEDRGEKYLIVLTTDELLKAKTSMSTWRIVPIILPGIVGAVPVGKYEKLIPHSPIGRINIACSKN